MTASWETALKRLSSHIAPQNFDLWLRPVECLGIDGDLIRLRAPNQYVRLWFESNYLAVVLDELKKDDPREYEVDIEVSEDDSTADLPPSPTPAAAVPERPPERSLHSANLDLNSYGNEPIGSVVATRISSHLSDVSRRVGLNPRNTFDTFVSGPSNQFASTAAMKMADVDPPPFNPLFLCGGPGLGKTHLLHAIGHHALRMRGDTRIAYVSGERFMNEFINAIRTDRMMEFRQRYREECDILLLDDIQFIAQKEQTQDEFFHTFNALYERGRKIVLSADRKPVEIPNFAERLRTRFQMGLTVDILPPDFEVRVAILRKKASDEHIPLPDEVSLYIAEAIKSNVRELEGALNRLVAYASLHQVRIDLEFAKRTLEGFIARPAHHVTVDHVMKTVANYYGVKLHDLKGAKRHKAIIGPRAVAMFLARKHTGDSYPDLGRAFGDKHHTSVLSAVQKTEERLKTELALRNEIEAIESQLTR